MVNLEKMTEARWLFDIDCPVCMRKNGGSGMIVQDQFGVFCVIQGCGWKESDDFIMENNKIQEK